VGAAEILVQEAGVGKMILMVGVAFADGVIVPVEQEETMKSKMQIGRSFLIMIPRKWWSPGRASLTS
jgi:hypothetical protein